MRSHPHAPSPDRQGPHLPASAIPAGQAQALDRRRSLDQQQNAYRGMHAPARGAGPNRRPPS
ncbi:hypothetical protein [Paludisphaera sp.]|uniref:hypothetical protein n=1 Tax=Paludisphaera sp. TaxID=2017432 RepID=UPI00301E1178